MRAIGLAFLDCDAADTRCPTRRTAGRRKCPPADSPRRFATRGPLPRPPFCSFLATAVDPSPNFGGGVGTGGVGAGEPDTDYITGERRDGGGDHGPVRRRAEGG